LFVFCAAFYPVRVCVERERADASRPDKRSAGLKTPRAATLKVAGSNRKPRSADRRGDGTRAQNKYQSRENRARVRRILVHDWDPIGIQDVPEASDEYDRYADKAHVMLMDDRATADMIAAYLYEIAAEHMGLGHNQRLAEVSKSVAETLVALRPEFETH